MNNFTEKFKTYSNAELLKIIENAVDYQPLAVETAKTIVSSRQLTNEDIEDAKAELESQRQAKEVHAQKVKNVENKVKNIAESILETINPIQTETPTTDKIIKIISIVFGGLFLLQLYKEFSMLSYMFSVRADWDFSMVLYYIPLLFLPTAAYLFYKRTKIGWILLSIYLTYSAVTSISLFFLALNREPSGIPALDSLYPTTSSSKYVLTLIFFGATLWFICNSKMRDVYRIDKKTMITILVLIASIAGLVNLALII